MVRTAGSQMCEFLGGARIDKSLNFRKIGKRPNHFFRSRYTATNQRKNIERDVLAIVERFVTLATKQAVAAFFDVTENKLSELIDDADGVLVAFTLRISPGE